MPLETSLRSLIGALAFSLTCCSTENGDPSKSHMLAGGITYTCEARDLFSGRVEIKSGGDQTEACARAQDECFAKSGNHCVVLRWYDDQTTAGGMTSGQAWACLVQENTGTGFNRSWVRPGPTLVDTRANALDFCERRKAGINCQIVRCFDASNERL